MRDSFGWKGHNIFRFTIEILSTCRRLVVLVLSLILTQVNWCILLLESIKNIWVYWLERHRHCLILSLHWVHLLRHLPKWTVLCWFHHLELLQWLAVCCSIMKCWLGYHHIKGLWDREDLGLWELRELMHWHIKIVAINSMCIIRAWDRLYHSCR